MGESVTVSSLSAAKVETKAECAFTRTLCADVDEEKKTTQEVKAAACLVRAAATNDHDPNQLKLNQVVKLKYGR